MGNKLSENKQINNILYKDIKNEIKQRKKLDTKNNIYICELDDQNLINLNDEVFKLYNIHKTNTEDRENERTQKNISENEDKEKDKSKDKSKSGKIKLKEKDEEKHVKIYKKKNNVEESASGIHRKKINDEGKYESKQVKDKESEKVKKKTDDSLFEIDYGVFYNIEESNTKFDNNVKHVKKKKLENHVEENEKKSDIKAQSVTKKKTAPLKKKSSLNMKATNSKKKYINEKYFYNDENDHTILIQNSQIDSKESDNLLKQAKLKPLTNESYTKNMKNNKNDINNSISVEIKEKKKHIQEKSKSDTLLNKFLNLCMKKKNLQNILLFLNSTDLLAFQKTCSISYICVSDFLDYICLNIYSNFKKAYDYYFTPYNFFYKYESLYTEKPSFRLDCILISKIKKECVGYNNRFGYKYNYMYDKKKNNYYVYFNFNVLKNNVPRTIEIHKDISYNNGDDINVSHIIDNDVCLIDYICIPINLYNYIGNVNFSSINFIPNKLSRYVVYNNHLDDQLWYNKEEYQILIKENNLITSESLLPHLSHINTIYSGIDVTVMKTIYRAIQSGKLGKKSYSMWGNYFIIKNKSDPIFIFLKREGLQHDCIYHNIYLRVNDHIVFYLIKGGNTI